MKKLLVILMLGAGFVTVASAGELYCTSKSSNQCCIDFQNMQVVLATNDVLYTTDFYAIFSMDPQLVNDGSHDTKCKNWDYYNIGDQWFNGLFEWQPGAWDSTIKFVSN